LTVPSRSITPDYHVRIRPTSALGNLDLAPILEFRDLLYFLVWRDVKVRYQQAFLGVVWAILQPVLTMAVFTVIFGRLAKMPSDGLPYPVFIFSALLPWQYFSQAISRGGGSLVNDANLVRKVYFPRLIIPLAAVVAPLVDFAAAFCVFLPLLLWYQIPLQWSVLTLPLFLLLALATALGVGLWLSALNARYRDVGHALPFLVQLWFFASPIAYPLTLLPEQWRALYGVNPMVGVIEGFRWALLGTPRPAFDVIAVSAIVIALLVSTGAVFFKRTERTLADIL
jgi:lipopolysaccharide transport system permease protein